ncbi:hypothetical protein [Alkalicoccobacillus porphyridii]|uniref:Uncharacterized protein n=1 Tax=Alkalicoccobacillus porphyridii TaxID=2597270 RepID=A0A553ZYS6_9BACI|nr:hypothetical protein [Alkalicoccobacillus porphyridii]TSB46536.1 hypothetical protein FN960_09225 [Alkalicoccobacillus porphyridii]
MFKDKPLYYTHFVSSIIYIIIGCLFATIIYFFNGNFTSALIIFGGMATLQLIFGFVRLKQHNNHQN